MSMNSRSKAIIVIAVLAGILSLYSSYVRMQSDNSITPIENLASTVTSEGHTDTDISTAQVTRYTVAEANSGVMNIVAPESSKLEDHGCTVKNETHGYILAVHLQQQSTGSFLAYSQLAKLASLFNLSMVEPYVRGTKVEGVPQNISGLSSQKSMTLGSFYDLISLKNTLKSCCYTSKIVTFETMLTKASHTVLYIAFIPSKSRFNFSQGKIREIERNDMTAYDKQLLGKLNSWASHISRDSFTPFQASRIFVVDARPTIPIYLFNITKVLGSIIHEEVAKSGTVTVVIGEWRGIHTIIDSQFFYYVPDFSSCNVYHTRHSEVIIKSAKEFAQTLSQIRPVIGVHIRGERLLMASAGSSYHMECLQELKTLLETLVNSTKAARESVHIFHDLGKYGTTTCKDSKYCTSGKSKYVSKFEELGFPVVSYDPIHFNLTSVNPTFVSFVEREYLTQVDILVTVGKGAYQQSIAERFLDISGKENLHRICGVRGKTY